MHVSVKNSRPISKLDLWPRPKISTSVDLHIACGTLVALNPGNNTLLANVIECDLVIDSPVNKTGNSLFLNSVDIRIRSDMIKILIPVTKIMCESEIPPT